MRHRAVPASLLSCLVAIAAAGWFAAAPSGSLLHAAAAQEPDTDGDTMPDAWETFFGLDPNDPSDATADPDGDGLTNAQEFAAHRHPVGRHARYFAEGSTGFFDTSVSLLNLSTTDTAHVAIALLNESGGVVSHQELLAPRQRRTVSIDDVLQVPAAVAIVVESDVPVAADRFMTWGSTGIGASLDSGSPAPATTWYFAEGATGPFLLYYLFENPGATPATVTTRYLVEGGVPVTTTRTLRPQSRTTVFVNADDPALAAASMGSVITSDAPIFAERAMYVLTNGTLGGGSASAGSNALATQWYFGEGSTGPFFHCFLSMLNPGSQAATATVTYHLSDGSTAAKDYVVPAQGRRTVYFNGEAEADPALAALATGPVWFTVSSTQPILGERAMWWADWPWYEGHAAPGNTTSAISWAVPDGRHGGPNLEETYVLIGNTTATPGQVRLTLIPDTGAPVTRDLAIAANERMTVNAGVLFGLTTDTRFSVIVDSLGTPPTPLAVDYARYRSVNHVPFSGGGAAPAIPVAPAGDAAPSVTATTPAANATGVAVDANLTVTFSEPVTAGAGAFVLECPLGTSIPLTTVTASPATTFTLDPASDLPVSTACRLRIVASHIADADTDDPPDAPAADVDVPFTTAACTAIVVSPTTVPGGMATVAYTPVTFTQTGGTLPVTWSVTAGTPPPGMSVSPAGVLAGTPSASGSSAFTVTVTDANSCTGSVPLTLSILAGPNQAPSFTRGADQIVLEDAGPQTMPWATAISPGASPDESGQVVTFVVDANTNPGLFSVGPAVSSTGTLTYTPAPNANGAASITLHARDNGGTANGGVDSSAPQTFTITVTPVNDAPGFTAGANQTVLEDAGAQTVAGWATTISAGPADEAGQTLTFVVTNNTNAALFSVAPAVSSTGTLTYTSAPNASGTASITLVLRDNGGTANGGQDTSAPHTFTITVSPVNDAPTLTTPTITYGTAGNTQLHVQGATLPGVASVSDPSGMLTKSGPVDGDGPAAPAAVALTNFDTGEGTLNLNADGSFTYVPDAGFTGTDTFAVQITDSVTPVTLTVQIAVGDPVWYVNNQTGPNNPPGSDGRSTDAWETLAEAQAGAGPDATIFVFNGVSQTTAYDTGIILQNGQKLIGEGVGLTVAGLGTIVPAGTRPRIVAPGDAVVVIANTANGDRTGIEVRGLNLTGTTSNAVDVSAANSQNLGIRISENTIVSGLDGIVIAAGSTGTATLAVHDNTITAGTTGMQIARTAGTVSITAFDDNVVTGANGGAGISVFGPIVFDATPGGALDPVNGGVTRIGVSGDGVGGNGLTLSNVSGALDFIDLDVFAGATGTALSVLGTGVFTGASGTRVTSAPGASTLSAPGGPAASLNNLTVDLQLAGLTSANSGSNGISLTSLAGTFTAPATATITNAANADVDISGGTANVTYGGTITDDVGQLVTIANTTGGTKSFTGAITDGNDGDGNGISLTSNTGATITFSGGLVLSTGANAAFTATGGGTINVCDENPCNPATGALANTLTTTTATALTIANTTIGASGVTFRSIAASGGTKGVTLNTTGTGAFTVTGTGAAGSGGTIQNESNRGAEFISTGVVTLNQMVFDNNGTGADDIDCGNALGATTNGALVTNAACVSNIHLQAVSGAVLTNVTANNSDGHGINAYQVGSLTLSGVTVERNGLQVGDDGVQLVNPTGTVTVGTSTFRDNASNQFEAQSGTGAATFTVTGSFFGLTNFPTAGTAEPPSPGPSTLNSGLLISGSGTANLTVTATGSTFEENYANGYLSDTAGSATMTITLGTGGSGNTFTNNGVPIEIVNASTGSMTYTLRSNTITNDTAVTGAFATTAIVAARSGAGSAMTGTIDANVIGSPGVVNSGCFVSLCEGISLPDSATASTNVYHVTVTNNQINHVQAGISSNIGGGDGSPRTSFVITGNAISNPDSTGSPLQNSNGILINSGTLPTSTPQTCVEVSGNTMGGNWGLAFNDDSIRFRHRGAAGSAFRVRNFTDGGDIDAFVTGANTAGAGTVDLFGFQLVGANVFTGGTSACP